MQNKSLIFLIDASGSMTTNGRMDAVNEAMKRIKIEVFDSLDIPAELSLNVRVLKFNNNSAEWIMGDENRGVDYTQYTWVDMEKGDFGGDTPTGKAIQKMMKCLYCAGEPTDPDQAAPGVILISDGEANGIPSVEDAIKEARAMKCGIEKKGMFDRALRAAIGINVGDVGRAQLESFGNLSKKMQAAGLKAYYDCSDNMEDLCAIVKSLTVNITIGDEA